LEYEDNRYATRYTVYNLKLAHTVLNREEILTQSICRSVGVYRQLFGTALSRFFLTIVHPDLLKIVPKPSQMCSIVYL